MRELTNVNKGGRPKKSIKKREHLAVMCSIMERRIIETKARRADMTVSEFLRELGLNGKVSQRIKTLPREVLELKGRINHIAASLNQIARKRNRNEDLNALERAMLNQQARELKSVTDKINGSLS